MAVCNLCAICCAVQGNGDMGCEMLECMAQGGEFVISGVGLASGWCAFMLENSELFVLV